MINRFAGLLLILDVAVAITPAWADEFTVSVPEQCQVTITARTASLQNFEFSLIQAGTGERWNMNQGTKAISAQELPDVLIVRGCFKNKKGGKGSQTMQAPGKILMDEDKRVVVGFDNTEGDKSAENQFTFTDAIITFDFVQKQK